MQAIFETLFAIVYLVTVIILGIRMIRGSKGRRQYLLYGIMAVTLGCGDAFHLIPRAVALCTTGLANYTAALGIGKLVTSITMTVFYVLLYYVPSAGEKASRQQCGCWHWPGLPCACSPRTPGPAQTCLSPGAFTATFPSPFWAG